MVISILWIASKTRLIDPRCFIPSCCCQYDQCFERNEVLVRILCTDEVATIIPKDIEGNQSNSFSHPEIDDDLFQDASLLTTASAGHQPSPYLTSFDLRNQKRGYNTYLPNSHHQFELYWRLLFGIDVRCTLSSDYSPAFTLHQTPLLEISGIEQSEPFQTIQILTSFGPKIVPRCVLYSG